MTALVCVLAEAKASFAFCCSAASSGAATPSTSRLRVAHSFSTAMASLCTFSRWLPRSLTCAITFSNAARIRSSCSVGAAGAEGLAALLCTTLHSWLIDSCIIATWRSA